LAKPALKKVVPPPPLARMIVPSARWGSFAQGRGEIGNRRASHADGGADRSPGRSGGTCNRAQHGDLAQTQRRSDAFGDGVVGESENAGKSGKEEGGQEEARDSETIDSLHKNLLSQRPDWRFLSTRCEGSPPRRGILCDPEWLVKTKEFATVARAAGSSRIDHFDYIELDRFPVLSPRREIGIMIARHTRRPFDALAGECLHGFFASLRMTTRFER
jgi:hypothetical protein